MVVPQQLDNLYIMDNPIKMDDLMVPLFQETTMNHVPIYDLNGLQSAQKPHGLVYSLPSRGGFFLCRIIPRLAHPSTKVNHQQKWTMFINFPVRKLLIYHLGFLWVNPLQIQVNRLDGQFYYSAESSFGINGIIYLPAKNLSFFAGYLAHWPWYCNWLIGLVVSLP